MRAEPKTILNFISSNFELMRDIFELQSKSDIIRKEALSELCVKHNVQVMEQLVAYRLLKKVNDDFMLREAVSQLFGFLLNEFKIRLPETIEKYVHSIADIFRKMQEEQDADKQLLINRQNDLANQISQFLEEVEKNTGRLLTESRALKANIQKTDYKEKVRKASFWIEYYIQPLNIILDINHSESITNKLHDIAAYANIKRFSETDETARRNYESLYGLLLVTNVELLRQSKILTNELLPLIERIKTESLILSGFIEMMKNPYRINHVTLLKPSRYAPLSEEVMLKTKEFFELFSEMDDYVIDDNDLSNAQQWIFDKSIYKLHLKQKLPVNDFFGWCANMLGKEDKVINTDKLFALTTLLFEDEYELQFDEGKMIDIPTDTAIYTTPTITVA